MSDESELSTARMKRYKTREDAKAREQGEKDAARVARVLETTMEELGSMEESSDECEEGARGDRRIDLDVTSDDSERDEDEKRGEDNRVPATQPSQQTMKENACA